MGLARDIDPKLSLELTTVQAICQKVDTPRSLAVFLMIKYKEYQQLVDLSIDPSHYEDVQHFADDYLVTEILRKSPRIPLGIDKKAVALNSFKESEVRCSAANDRLWAIKEKDLPKSILIARRWIYRVLPSLTKERLMVIESLFGHGGGATTGVRGRGSVLSDKYDGSIHLTQDLYPFYRGILGDRWWDYLRDKPPEVVLGNRFATVPKTAKTDRGICIEPTLNQYCQRGVGQYIRKRLKLFGFDLSTQEVNQSLAKKAYSDKLATIDLSAASDSLCRAAVELMVPPDWYYLLDTLRSKYTDLGNGEFVYLNKFASMGNGYTFELESLLFGAIALACTRKDDRHLVSVFGDDIIVPSYAATGVIDTLEFLGFSVNSKKSFLAGNFFESCGADFFKGQNVRPFYLRQEQGSKIPYPLQAANALRLYAKRRGLGFGCDARFQPIWKGLVKQIPSIWRKCRVPEELGDTGLISTLSEASPRRLRYGLEGWAVPHISIRPVQRTKRTFGRLLLGLARPAPDTPTNGSEPIVGFLGKPVPRLAIVHRWSEGLGWIKI